MESKTFTLELPASSTAGTVNIESGQSIVIVGANGSGKTRLGTWIEFKSKLKEVVHRISAQKSLTMPEYSSTSPLERAETEIRFGYWDFAQIRTNFDHYKTTQRWGQNPNTFLLNDFEKLMVYLFSERFETSNTYLQASQASSDKVPPPQTKLDIIKRVWELILPHRELEITAGKIQTRVKGGDTPHYSASEMSDGERVIFYLIGQALAAAKDGVIIVDEPELHLHKSIQTWLWREVQTARPDCLFVYMTHDVDFAASLTEAKKIWLKSFDGQLWEWEEAPSIEGFPEELLLQILGSRRPILFIEGESGSYDVALFRELYPDYAVISRGSCSQVILATQALREAIQFHHLEAHGIIDRDRRNSEQITSLKSKGIEVINVAEIENLFCVPEVLKLVAEQQGFPSDEKFEKAKSFVFRALQKELEVQISLHVADEIKFRLNIFDTKKRGASELRAELESRVTDVDVEGIYTEVKSRFDNVIQRQDYIGALALFNRKGLAVQLSDIFEIKNLPAYVLRMMQSSKSNAWIQSLNSYIPKLG
jgi:hypothetical protein